MTEVKFVFSSHTEKEREASSDLVTECFDAAMGAAYGDRYNWQFLENPAGMGRILMAYVREKPIGQVASIPCKYVFNDRPFTTVIAGEWLCVSPQYRGKGIMSELIQRNTDPDENPHPFVLDLPNEASMNGFLKSGYFQMPMELLIRPLKLSKCFAYKKVPRIILRPFDGVWKKRTEIELDGFTLEDYSGPTYDHRFDELFNDANNKSMIRQVRNSEFLNWRYRNVPGRNYKTIISKNDDGKLNGYIVLRLAIAYGVNVGFIMDIVNRDGSEVGKPLIRYALNYFWDNDVAVAAALCFPDCIENSFFRKEGFFTCPKRIRPNPFTLCMKPLYNKQNQFDTATMTDSRRWYFMFGDFQVF